MNTTNSSQLPSQLLSSAGWMLIGDCIRKINEVDSAAPSSLMPTMMDEGFITSCPQNAFNLQVDAINQILSPLAFHKEMTSLAQKRLALKSSALGYPQPASSSLSLPQTTMYLPLFSFNALIPFFNFTFISQYCSISSVRDILFLLSNSIKQASFEHSIISAAKKRSFPASVLPPDMLSLLDTEGDFAERKDFFSTEEEGELKRAL
ncbi:uncharacterized protein MONOS_13461 [Monocercomonoides exilis]|uniref:uncharacterized protein n=1 Tax=Monocercomonoides exilis TaxID=2049356 RepID=UPI003559E06E|nr:hypothetical protein MONOS_13461 [Monocercomonoides exilis]|eukprot:MONOS_13461.1-p1 / transcript=MONOS_13461.1 / gene=MONOS_13461 / organism=Monocercomonoides_exilis_PA203 / gene_product=unspecified product / transcript_product=unspecified product / location=Mono_scaffold00832:2077-2694(+) / protein_length=206 / sequence_SO=supercontig / SO=protein_coding / is_pseudo=false